MAWGFMVLGFMVFGLWLWGLWFVCLEIPGLGLAVVFAGSVGFIWGRFRAS